MAVTQKCNEMNKNLKHLTDYLSDAPPCLSDKIKFNYEFTVTTRQPVADYSGNHYPRSIAAASLMSALKLFLGLETRRDKKNRQINDDEEYIVQSATTNICFGYSCEPEEFVHDSLLLYGYDYKMLSKSDCTKEEMYEAARDKIESGLPVIIFPKKYSDIIFATGYSDGGATLKGMGFLDGDDRKNAAVSFKRLKQYTKWYSGDFDMMLLKPAAKITPKEAYSRALLRGIEMLSNEIHTDSDPMRGYGLVMYDNWCALLEDESREDKPGIESLFPHAYIHYENKLRTKQFFERCVDVLGLDMTPVVEQYEQIVAAAGEIAGIANDRNTFSDDALAEKRNQVIDMLKQSRRWEELALQHLKKAAATIK